jgi:RNA polymerase sigma factor (TIGR02999 family)
MNSAQPEQLTQLLIDWSNGDKVALDKLMPIVFDELRRLARYYMKRERAGVTLQTTALVNEAYLRLIDQRDVQWQNRAHFFGLAGQLMRRILIDQARRRQSEKRGGDVGKVALEEAATVSGERAAELIALDDALAELEKLDPRRGRVVELRFFGGLSIEETAEVMGVSPATVTREWSAAKAWLYRAMSQSDSDGAGAVPTD